MHSSRNASIRADRTAGQAGVLVTLLVTAAVCMLIANVSSAIAAGDAAKGHQYFESYCSICHSPQAGRNGVGPSLFGVVGRKSASEAGYNYSPAFRAANVTWDDATLNKYLTAPREMIPGTKMSYAGLKDDQKRADMIAYLATLK